MIAQVFAVVDCLQSRWHAYWALVESDRTNLGPRQRGVVWLGVMKFFVKQGEARHFDHRKSRTSSTGASSTEISLT